MLRRTVREYVRDRLQPLCRRVEEEDEIPPEIVKEMADLGFFGLPFPEEYQGAGLGELGYAVAMEELGAVNAAYGNLIGAHTGIAATSIYLDGTEEQKQRYLVPMCRGEKIGAFALTEPNAGSDAAAIETTARRRGGAYLLNGSKIWITNGNVAQVLVVFAVTDRSLGPRGGISAFIVESGFPGFRVGKVDEKMGLRGSHTAELIFEDCEVPAENLLGEPGLGFVTAMKALDIGRIGLAAGAVGAAQHALELSVQWANQRVQFGKPIGELQAIQWMLADMATEIHAGRWMTYHAAWKADSGLPITREAAMVKLFCSEMANRVIDLAVQIHGGTGYMKEFGIERMYRDARILKIYEGTNEIQRLVIARELLRAGR
ncbi:MAG: acyl-CoA dehydrogenase family protein [Acetobacteraceae bacterium]|nr:acyl-CoA dehydrogenase family protein [Acetobacteraceae bacterium]